MSRIEAILERLRIPVMLLAAVSLVTLVGCKGATEAPFGSTIAITNLYSVPPTATGTKSSTFQVSVFDSAGLPLSDVDVSLLGLFSCSTSSCDITMAGAAGNNTAPINGKVTTGAGGFKIFDVTAPTGALIAQIGTVTGVTATTSQTGAGMTDGTYTYLVSAENVLGEAISLSATASAVISNATFSADTVTVNWTTVAGASAYRVYNQNRGDYHQVTVPPFVDLGAPGVTAPYPTAPSNTTSGSSNRVTGSMLATSGAAQAVAPVGF